jgi:hypothetical protein
MARTFDQAGSRSPCSQCETARWLSPALSANSFCVRTARSRNSLSLAPNVC